MVDVYLPRRAVLVRTLVWSVAMTVWLNVARAIDLFGWYDDEDRPSSFGRLVLQFVVGVIVFMVVALSEAPWLILVVGAAFVVGLVRDRRRSPRGLADLEADLRTRLALDTPAATSA